MRLHLTATKPYLINLIHDSDAAHVLGDEWEGKSKEEAIAAIEEDPREVIPVGACDNQDERGYCKGHR